MYSLYLHIPFCRHRCGYCDFNTYAGLSTLIPDYVQALCREIDLAVEAAGERLPVHTVFFGGGTPSLLSCEEVEKILDALGRSFRLLPGLETTLEANPGTLSAAYLRDLRSLGVNRLSLGMQSASPEELILLEREHSFFEVIQAVTWAREAAFDNLNLDLIFGLPYQQMDSWQRTLELALNLQPEHFSLYALTLEHGTPLRRWADRGLLALPDPDLAAEMYEWADSRLVSAGYVQYEISNWARGEVTSSVDNPSLACRHNLQYWRNRSYLGFGAGAHGYAGGFRTANVLPPAGYIQRLRDGKAGEFPRTPATQTLTPIGRDDELGETMMMGLRLTREGVSQQTFQERFGQPLEAVFPEAIRDLTRVGLLEWAGERSALLRLTPAGRLLGNQVFMRFL